MSSISWFASFSTSFLHRSVVEDSVKFRSMRNTGETDLLKGWESLIDQATKWKIQATLTEKNQALPLALYRGGVVM